MSVSTITLVLMAALALAAAADSKKTGEGLCPEVSTMENFNATAMSGIWYDIAHTNRRTGLKLKCDVIKFTPDPTSSNQISFGSYSYSSATKQSISVMGTAATSTRRNSLGAGKMTVKIPSLNIDNSEVKVLSTDYTTFAVLYSCLEKNDAFTAKALILTREKEPSSRLKSAAFKVLENNKIPRRELRMTVQTKCHDYDFTSTTENHASTLGHGTSMGGLLSGPTPAQQSAAHKPTRSPLLSTLG